MSTVECGWELLLNEGRRKKDSQKLRAIKAEQSDLPSPQQERDPRTEIERDYDRILFATPTRRLADKTQVFPLDSNDSVRTRLTHSHEVSNLGRSIGIALACEYAVAAEARNAKPERNLPSLLAASGLVHDLGNPPFGHQGEIAIRSWFADNQEAILKPLDGDLQLQLDFLKFEGNAQGFRLVTRLQVLNDDFGLDLTYGTLAAMMKYPTRSNETNLSDDGPVARKKYGFFKSEEHVAQQVWGETGLGLWQRHPAAYLMEACDDIAYVVLDAEDAVKKNLASFSDLLSFLEHHSDGDPIIDWVVAVSAEKHKSYRESEFRLSPAELNDISMQRFRVYAIGELVKAATRAFLDNQTHFLTGLVEKPLLKISQGEKLRKVLKEFSYKHAYTHRSVLKVELEGYNVIRGLMNLFWAAIVDRKNPADAASDRLHPFSRFVYGRISENYRRVFENPIDEVKGLPMRYRECQLLTDMLSGMTDSYAIALFKELSAMQGDYDPARFLRAPKS